VWRAMALEGGGVGGRWISYGSQEILFSLLFCGSAHHVLLLS